MKKKPSPEMIIDPHVEEEPTPRVIDIATSSTEAETVKQAGPDQKPKEESEKGEMQKPGESTAPIIATTKWEPSKSNAISSFCSFTSESFPKTF